MIARKRSRPGVMVAFRCPPLLLKRLMKYARDGAVRRDRTRAILVALDSWLPR